MSENYDSKKYWLMKISHINTWQYTVYSIFHSVLAGLVSFLTLSVIILVFSKTSFYTTINTLLGSSLKLSVLKLITMGGMFSILLTLLLFIVSVFNIIVYNTYAKITNGVEITIKQ